MKHKRFHVLTALCGLHLLSVPALAQQWQSYNVTPPGRSAGLAAVYGDQQVGWLVSETNDLDFLAAIRDHQSGTWTMLHPDDWLRSFVGATDGTLQAGFVTMGNINISQAAVWSGTKSSFTT